MISPSSPALPGCWLTLQSLFLSTVHLLVFILLDPWMLCCCWLLPILCFHNYSCFTLLSLTTLLSLPDHLSFGFLVRCISGFGSQSWIFCTQNVPLCDPMHLYSSNYCFCVALLYPLNAYIHSLLNISTAGISNLTFPHLNHASALLLLVSVKRLCFSGGMNWLLD